MKAFNKTLSTFFVVLLLSVSKLSFAAVPQIFGDWTLYYDWGCDGTYSSTTITLNTDRTFSTGEGSAGKWALIAGIVTFQFDTVKTTYSGTRASRAVTGVSSVFNGLNGCFNMIQGVSLAPHAAVKQEVRSATGQ